jgi:hypothetical protein
MQKVFISYSRKNGDFAEIVSARIANAGFSSWMDLVGIRAGEDWRQEIDQAIRDSLALILIVTPAAMDSSYVSYEWAFALGAGLTVIPLLLEPTEIHARLAALHCLEFTHRETRPWQGLLDALQSAAHSQPTHSIKLPRNTPALVKHAVAALDNPDRQVMEQAMLRLAQMKLPDAEAAMIQALNHPLPEVRIAAGRRLAERGNVKAVPGLIEGTRREGWGYEFGRTVAQIGAAAIPSLLAALNDEAPSVRCDLVRALEQIGDPAVVPEIVKLLQDTHPLVRQAAMRALKGLGTPEALRAVDDALPGLIHDLQDADGVVRYQAATVLKHIGSEPALDAVAEWERAQKQTPVQP